MPFGVGFFQRISSGNKKVSLIYPNYIKKNENRNVAIFGPSKIL
jgi:hypothetical protein